LYRRLGGWIALPELALSLVPYCDVEFWMLQFTHWDDILLLQQ
jgi:hypothetical protein